MNKCQDIVIKIKKLTRELNRPVNLMEVCGTHTQAISKNGIRQLMPDNINLITGPGCPVCVTDQRDIDNIVTLCLAGVPIATYGDAVKVPGNFGSLEEARAKGGKVFPVYSIEEALRIREDYPDLVFFGIGFETTAPMTAYAVKNGLSVYSAHKLFIPAMSYLLDNNKNIDGFISPGHVSAIVGADRLKSIKAPQVITGFEAEDVLISIYLLLRQLKKKTAVVENEYTRAVTDKGNSKAYEMIFDVFDKSIGVWRGLGEIPGTGLELKTKYKAQDAKIKYIEILKKVKHAKNFRSACKCGDIIQGLRRPQECPMFSKACNPENPYGPCMVSVEGACRVEYDYK